MLDIGTMPAENSLLKLYAHMQADVNCGGCCGEIEVDLASTGGGGFFSYLVQAAQFFEYKLGHSPDKSCESFFGFTQVLPGAYSLFRWKAIKGDPLEAFFKNVTRSEVPSCSEANEYLAEDRIMCLQIYIKKNDRYTLAYVPNAPAITDAPPNIFILMKQRRRWMNGAMFGTAKVLGNFVDMISCKRTKHSCIRQAGIALFLTYMVTLFTLQFFIVGAMFAAIYAFFNQVFTTLFATNTELQSLWESGTLMNIFTYIYILQLVIGLILSLSVPLDRAKTCFYIVITIFGIMTLLSIVGMTFYLSASGLFPHRYTRAPDGFGWEQQPDTHFSYLVLGGIIMLCVYLVPIVMRPIDFLRNFRGYILGLISYLCLIPMFTNVFSIYAMSNLHDISWGNRPTTTGTEAFSSNAQT